MEWLFFQKSPQAHLDPRVTPLVTGADLDYFANDLASPRNLRDHVGNILIPRVSGTQGNKQVREVRCRVAYSLGRQLVKKVM